MFKPMHSSFVVNCVVILIATSTGSLAADGDDVTWSPEHDSNSCVDERYNFPASLVPIQDDDAATGGLHWQSFDKKITLWYEDKATYFGTTQMDRKTFLDNAKCDLLDPHRYPSETDKLLSCEEGRNKLNYMVTYGKRQVCSHVFTIAPDPTDKSRFVTELTVCGPSKQQKLIATISHRMFTSISLVYKGCCKKTNRNGGNYLGCKDK